MSMLGMAGLIGSIIFGLIWIFFHSTVAIIGIIAGLICMSIYIFNDDKKQSKMPIKYIAIYK